MARSAEQLPRGRHGLEREEVRRSQQTRMLRSMIEVVAEKGYARTTVADVIAGAGVSRETFYELFRDKEDAFAAALELCAQTLAGRIVEGAGDAATDSFERFDRALAVYLGTLAENPALARTFLVDSYGAGEVALRRRVEVFEAFVKLFADAFGARTAEELSACEALVGAVSSIVTMRVAAGRTESLPELYEPLREVARRLLG